MTLPPWGERVSGVIKSGYLPQDQTEEIWNARVNAIPPPFTTVGSTLRFIHGMALV
jgi:hypothetical protein